MLRRCARALSCAVLVAALTGAWAPAASAADPACVMGDTRVSTLTEFGAQFVTTCLINAERTARGIPPLTMNRQLALAGDGYAQAMVAGRFFSHYGPGGDSPLDRVQAQGYIAGSDQWQVGETLAWGNGPLSTPRSIVDGWMASPEHVAVLLDPAFREIGIGIRFGAPVSPTPDGENVTYAADFGARSQVVVDDEPAYRARFAPGTVAASARRRRAACRKRAHTARSRARCARAAR